MALTFKFQLLNVWHKNKLFMRNKRLLYGLNIYKSTTVT